jgi:hypothetical protein
MYMCKHCFWSRSAHIRYRGGLQEFLSMMTHSSLNIFSSRCMGTSCCSLLNASENWSCYAIIRTKNNTVLNLLSRERFGVKASNLTILTARNISYHGLRISTIKKNNNKSKSRDSSVCIVIGYGLVKFFFSSQRTDRFWGSPSLLSNGRRVWSGRGLKLSNHLHLVLRLMMELYPRYPICLHDIMLN